MSERIERLIASMTPDELAGQLNLVPCDGPDTGEVRRAIAAGAVGGVLKSWGAARNRRLQEAAVGESRLGIPVLFQDDVIHGLRTVFPIPLGEAATWDEDAVERASAVAAREAAAAGLHLTYAPMVDVGRDARWGRIMETSGEDPLLGARLAAARVRGFQGAEPAAAGRVLACAKHFAGYGDALAGIDYLVNEFSGRALRETHLPPFRAAVRAGVAWVMCAYTAHDGVPATANRYLLEAVLRGELGFSGVVVSDWQTINNLVRAGVAADLREAARMALKAGVDVDMASGAYLRWLPDLLREGVITRAEVERAVRRVLEAKERIGLFDDPFRGCDEAVEREVLSAAAHRAAARDVARRSLVLLQNRGGVLPLRRGCKVAVVGPMAGEARSPLGWWEGHGEAAETVTLLAGMIETGGEETTVVWAAGCGGDGLAASDEGGIAEAVAAAAAADVVVVAVGEWFDMSGEAGSRADIGMPAAQGKLVRALHETGKPLVMVVYTGRPLVLTEECGLADAVVVVWQPGTMGGLAIGDVLFGDAAPSGKLPVSFPRHGGQVPCYYGHRRSSHPHAGGDRYSCRHLDVAFGPLFGFGHGLSYTSFAHGPVRLSAARLAAGGELVASVEVTNTGGRAGREVVQCYLRDDVCPVLRPALELKDFQTFELAPGASVVARFTITEAWLEYPGLDGRGTVDPGSFTVLIGPDLERLQAVSFEYFR